MYKDKAIPTNGIVEKIVKKQAVEFSKSIDNVFGEIDFDAPDVVAREILKLNTWQFSSAKNNADLKALNNLLIDKNGEIRPRSEFIRLAKGIVGNSARYLKTEHNTIIKSAQMARLWQEIQRSKHIFPYLKFRVVKDGHTSDICEPLIDVIVSVDDPMLLTYFPPNHFNCRTTVTKLRRGTPTKNYALPEIHKSFKNNVGISLKIFTEDNSYIKNAPGPVINLATSLYEKNKFLERYKNYDFEETKSDGKGVLEIFTTGSQSKKEFAKNKRALSF